MKISENLCSSCVAEGIKALWGLMLWLFLFRSCSPPGLLIADQPAHLPSICRSTPRVVYLLSTLGSYSLKARSLFLADVIDRLPWPLQTADLEFGPSACFPFPLTYPCVSVSQDHYIERLCFCSPPCPRPESALLRNLPLLPGGPVLQTRHCGYPGLVTIPSQSTLTTLYPPPLPPL